MAVVPLYIGGRIVGYRTVSASEAAAMAAKSSSTSSDSGSSGSGSSSSAQTQAAVASATSSSSSSTVSSGSTQKTTVSSGDSAVGALTKKSSSSAASKVRSILEGTDDVITPDTSKGTWANFIKKLAKNTTVKYITENGKQYAVVGDKKIDLAEYIAAHPEQVTNAPTVTTTNAVAANAVAASASSGSSGSSESTTSSSYYDVDTALKSVYSQAKAAGINISAPTSYGSKITSQSQAQKIIDEYTAKANAALTASNKKAAAATSAKATTTTTYDISANVKNIQATAKQYGVTLAGLSQTSYSSQAAAQKALDNYYSSAQKALSAKLAVPATAAETPAKPTSYYTRSLTSSEQAEYDSMNNDAVAKYGKHVNPEYYAWLKGASSLTVAPKYYTEDAQKESQAEIDARNTRNAQREAQVAASQAKLQESYNAMLKAKGTTSAKNSTNNASNTKSANYSKGTPATFSNANNKVNKITVVKAADTIKATNSPVKTTQVKTLSAPWSGNTTSISTPVVRAGTGSTLKATSANLNKLANTKVNQVAVVSGAAAVAASLAASKTNVSTLNASNLSSSEIKAIEQATNKTLLADRKTWVNNVQTNGAKSEHAILNNKTYASSEAEKSRNAAQYIQKLAGTYVASKRATSNQEYDTAVAAKAAAERQAQVRAEAAGKATNYGLIASKNGIVLNRITDKSGNVKTTDRNALGQDIAVLTPVLTASQKAQRTADYKSLISSGKTSSNIKKGSQQGESIFKANEPEETQYYSQTAGMSAEKVSEANLSMPAGNAVLTRGFQTAASSPVLNISPKTGEYSYGTAVMQKSYGDVSPFKTVDQIKEETRLAKINKEYAESKAAAERVGGVLGAAALKSTELNRDFQNGMTKQNLTRVLDNTNKSIEQYIPTTDSIHAWRDRNLGGIPGFTKTQQKIDEAISNNPWASAYRDLSYDAYNYARSKPINTAAVVGSTVVGGEALGALFGTGKLAIAAAGAKGTRLLTPVVEGSLERGVGSKVATVIGESGARTLGLLVSKAPVWSSKTLTAGVNTYFEADIAKTGINSLYGEDTTENILKSAAAGAATGYAKDSVLGAVRGGVSGTELGIVSAANKDKNYKGFLGTAITFAAVAPFFGKGEQKVNRFFSRESADTGVKVAGWVSAKEEGTRTAGREILTHINGQKVATVEGAGKSTTVKTLNGESLGKDRLTFKNIKGEQKQITPSLSSDAHIRNVRTSIGELAKEGMSTWSPSHAAIGVVKNAGRLTGQGIGLVRTDVVEINQQPYFPIETRGAVLSKLTSGDTIDAVRGVERHLLYQEVLGKPKTINALKTKTGVEMVTVKLPHIERTSGFLGGSGKGISIPGTSTRRYLPVSIEMRERSFTGGRLINKVLGKSIRPLTRDYGDNGRFDGGDKYKYGGQSQYGNPKLQEQYYEVGELFAQKGSDSPLKHEIQIVKNIKSVHDELQSSTTKEMIDQINTSGQLKPDTYKSAGYKAKEMSANLGEPIAISSPKTASGYYRPESEISIVHNSPWATTETSRKFTGWTKSGTPVYEISFGNQPKIKGNILGRMIENAKYNWKNALSNQGEYVKGMASRANQRHSEEIALVLRSAGYNVDVIGRPQEFTKHSTNTLEHTTAVADNMRQMYEASPQLRKHLQNKYSPWNFGSEQLAQKSALRYQLKHDIEPQLKAEDTILQTGLKHDSMRIKEVETVPIVHDKAMAKAVEQNRIDDLEYLSDAERRQITEAIGSHTNAKQPTLYNLVRYPENAKYLIRDRSELGKMLDNADRIARAEQQAKADRYRKGGVEAYVRKGFLWDLPVDSNTRIGKIIKSSQMQPGLIQTTPKTALNIARKTIEELPSAIGSGNKRFRTFLSDESTTKIKLPFSSTTIERSNNGLTRFIADERAEIGLKSSKESNRIELNAHRSQIEKQNTIEQTKSSEYTKESEVSFDKKEYAKAKIKPKKESYTKQETSKAKSYDEYEMRSQSTKHSNYYGYVKKYNIKNNHQAYPTTRKQTSEYYGSETKSYANRHPIKSYGAGDAYDRGSSYHKEKIKGWTDVAYLKDKPIPFAYIRPKLYENKYVIPKSGLYTPKSEIYTLKPGLYTSKSEVYTPNSGTYTPKISAPYSKTETINYPHGGTDDTKSSRRKYLFITHSYQEEKKQKDKKDLRFDMKRAMRARDKQLISKTKVATFEDMYGSKAKRKGNPFKK